MDMEDKMEWVLRMLDVFLDQEQRMFRQSEEDNLEREVSLLLAAKEKRNRHS